MRLKHSLNLKCLAATCAITALTMKTTAMSDDFGFGVSTEPEITWETVDCGGGMISAAQGPGIAIELTSTIGQHDAFADGPLMAGAYEFAPGFWPGTNTAPSTCTGDIAPPPQGDQLVNVDDMLLVISTWGSSGSGDVNHDGIVNVNDLLAVIGAWGACP